MYKSLLFEFLAFNKTSFAHHGLCLISIFSGVRFVAGNHDGVSSLQVSARARSTSLVSEAIATRWLRDHGGINVQSKVDNAAHLELRWGARIREHHGQGIESSVLSNWMLTTVGVSVPPRVCQAWLTRDWASSGALLVSEAVEDALGDKLLAE